MNKKMFAERKPENLTALNSLLRDHFALGVYLFNKGYKEAGRKACNEAMELLGFDLDERNLALSELDKPNCLHEDCKPRNEFKKLFEKKRVGGLK